MLLLVWLGEKVLVFVLPVRKINSLRERGVVGNFVLGNFLAYNFIKMKSSENHLVGFFSEVLKEQVFSKTPQDLPPKQKFYMLPPHGNFSAHVIGKFWSDHKVLILLNETPPIGWGEEPMKF